MKVKIKKIIIIVGLIIIICLSIVLVVLYFPQPVEAEIKEIYFKTEDNGENRTLFFNVTFQNKGLRDESIQLMWVDTNKGNNLFCFFLDSNSTEQHKYVNIPSGSKITLTITTCISENYFGCGYLSNDEEPETFAYSVGLGHWLPTSLVEIDFP